MNLPAIRANLSLSLVRKVEREAVPASPTFIASAARALGLLVTDLTQERDFRSIGGPYGAEQKLVPDVERAIIEGDDAGLDGPLLEVTLLSQQLRGVVASGRTSTYTEVLGVLPNLLRHLHVNAVVAKPDDVEHINRLLAQAYYSAMFATYKFGHVSLSAWAAERMFAVAQLSGDPLWAVMGLYGRSQALMFGGSYRASGAVLERAASAVEGKTGPGAFDVRGAIHLSQAVINARLGNLPMADAHLREADDLARYLSNADDPYDVAFSTANVKLHAVAVAIESSQPAKAVERATELNTTIGLYASRLGHLHIDLARAHLMKGDHERVVHELHLARQLSPQQTRYHPQVHETIRALARARRRSDPVARLAAWAGLLS